MRTMVDSPRARPRLPYYPALDGFRAIALSVMLFFHGGFEWATGAFLSISAFFTLSGFLITGLLVLEYEGTGTIGLAAFWERRFRRLMPAAVLGLLGMSLYAAFVAAPSELLQIRGDVLAALFYVANWRFIWTEQSYARILTDPSPVQHFWSLGIEEQFYFFFPLLVLGVLTLVPASRRALAAMLVVLSLVSVSLMAWLHVPGEDFSRSYYGTDTRAAELFVGALLALAYAGCSLDPRRGVSLAANIVGGVALVVSVTLWVSTREGAPWFFEGGSILYSLLTAAIIVGAIRPGPLRSFLSFAPFCWVGWISYGLYVFHWPIFLWLDADRTGLSGWGLFALRMAVTTAVAVTCYRLLEIPIRSRRFVPGRRAWFVAPIAVASVVLAIVLVSDSFYRPGFAALEQQAENSRDDGTEPPREDHFRILVVGDSIAWNMANGLHAWAQKMEGLDLQISNHGNLGCGIARGGIRRLRKPFRAAYVRKCWQWEERWAREVERFQPHAVVVLTGVWDLADTRMEEEGEFQSAGDREFDDWLVAEYTVAARLLSANGARVVWATYPCLGPQSRPEQVDGASRFAGSGAFSNDRIRHLNEQILPRVEGQLEGRMTIAPFFDWICPGGEYTTRLGPAKKARRDGLHLMTKEARWAAGLLFDWLEPAAPSSWRRERAKDLENRSMSRSSVREAMPLPPT